MESTHSSIYTIGYQGKTIEGFLAELVDAGIQTLVDVRRRAFSRKPGFSKKRLAAALDEVGIDYWHYADLGMPRELMPQRNLSDNSRILGLYGEQLDAHKKPLREVLYLARSGTVCLLCFEADYQLCHRHVLATRLVEELGCGVVHI